MNSQFQDNMFYLKNINSSLYENIRIQAITHMDTFDSLNMISLSNYETILSVMQSEKELLHFLHHWKLIDQLKKSVIPGNRFS